MKNIKVLLSLIGVLVVLKSGQSFYFKDAPEFYVESKNKHVAGERPLVLEIGEHLCNLFDEKIIAEFNWDEVLYVQ